MVNREIKIKSTIIPITVWLALILALILLLHPKGVLAQPIAEAKSDDVRIVLTDEPCELKEISNLPKRVTWTERGKVTEGCWGGRPDTGVIVAYFADKTAVAIPMQAFARVQSI